jgi:hypothetical protein
VSDVKKRAREMFKRFFTWATKTPDDASPPPAPPAPSEPGKRDPAPM